MIDLLQSKLSDIEGAMIAQSGEDDPVTADHIKVAADVLNKALNRARSV